jgi:predicted amidophosphoribosyltransferase
MATPGTCATCGGLTSVQTVTRCQPCFRATLRDNRPYCLDCRKRIDYRCVRCRSCHAETQRTSSLCPTCRGLKQHRSRTCAACYRVALKTATVVDGIVKGFNHRRFDAYLRRPDVELSAADLFRMSGVAETTISRWRTGTQDPRQVELDLVLDTLGFVPCGACGGMGKLDEREALRQSFMRPAQPAPIPLRIVRPDPTPITGPVHLACGLTFDPCLLRLVGRGVVVPLTRTETVILTAYVRIADSVADRVEVARLIDSTSHALNSHTTRLNAKLRAAGIDPAEVWEGGGARGLRLRLANAPAVEGVG